MNETDGNVCEMDDNYGDGCMLLWMDEGGGGVPLHRGRTVRVSLLGLRAFSSVGLSVCSHPVAPPRGRAPGGEGRALQLLNWAAFSLFFFVAVLTAGRAAGRAAAVRLRLPLCLPVELPPGLWELRLPLLLAP